MRIYKGVPFIEEKDNNFLHGESTCSLLRMADRICPPYFGSSSFRRRLPRYLQLRTAASGCSFCCHAHRFFWAFFWAGIFTWAYRFASLPEKKHLGDYYVLGALLFSLPDVYMIGLTKCGGYVRAALQVMYGAFNFFMLLFPLIYICCYLRRGIYESDHNRSTLL